MLKSKKQNQPLGSFFLQKKNNPLLFCLLRIRGSFSYNHPVICRDRDLFKQSSAFLFEEKKKKLFYVKTPTAWKEKKTASYYASLAVFPLRRRFFLAPLDGRLRAYPDDNFERTGVSKRNIPRIHERSSLIIPLTETGDKKGLQQLLPKQGKEMLEKKDLLPSKPFYHRKKENLFHKKSYYVPFILNQPTLRALDGSSYSFFLPVRSGRKRSPSDSASSEKKITDKKSHLKPFSEGKTKKEPFKSGLEEGSNTKKSRFFKERNAYLIPDFVEIQRKSFFQLLESGLIEEFSKRNPITNKNLEIFFYPEYYQLTPPEYNPRRAILISKSYSSKLFIPAQLTDKKLKKSQLKWVLIGNLPLMTKRGHFVLNGAPRVIVNQILRSPGIYFQGSLKEIFSDQWSEKPEITYKRFYTDLICLRGTWLRIEIDKNKDIWAQMKKVPKIPLLWFLLAMGLTERIIFKSVINPTRLLANFNLEIKRKIDYEYVTNASDAWKAISNLISSSSKETSSYALSTPTSTIPKSLPPFTKTGEVPFLKTGGGGGTPWLASSDSVFDSGLDSSEELDAPESGSPSLMAIKPGKGLLSPLEPIKKKKKSEKQLGVTPVFATQEKGFFPFTKKEKEPLDGLQGDKKEIKAESEAADFQDQNKQVIVSANNLPSFPPPVLVKGVEEKDFRGKESDLRSKEALISGIGTGRKLVSFLNIVEHSKEGRNWIFKRFMNPRAYDLGSQGRLNFNRKLGLSISSHQTTLTAQDVLFATDYLFKVEKGLKNIDDIDHLKNRRVRTSGELLQIQIGIGLVRLEKIIREKFSKINAQTRASDFLTSRPNNPKNKALKFEALPPPGVAKKIFPLSKGGKEVYGGTSSLSTEKGEEFKMNNLINTKAFNGALREFFGSSQLSQFMDQLNPLAEITHKRRLSSMGPGGVTRDSATLAIRGIHPTHYGRICPIETPEGKNTGLVNSLTTYSRASSQGFLESPFYKVYKGQVQKNAGMFFLSAEQEENIKVAAADVATPSGRIGFLPKNKIPAKIAYGDTISKISRNIVEYIGVSPIQMISIATSLIPFVEHDDANRALMGSNMQRQAVPLVRAERPLVGTGLESRTVSDSGHAVIAKESGYVAYVSGKKMVIYTIPTNN